MRTCTEHIFEWKPAARACALLAFAVLLGAAAGCPNKRQNAPIPITGKQPGMTAEESKPVVNSDPGDYFPLWIPASWSYQVRECYTRIVKEQHPAAPYTPDEVCTRYEIRTMLEKKVTIDGREVYLLLEGEKKKLDDKTPVEPQAPPAPSGKPDNKPAPASSKEKSSGMINGKGYMSDGDWVYLVFVKDGKITEKSVAGKHNLKPGDSWDKKFLAGYDETERLECGEPGFLHLPDDDPAPARYKTICCTNKNAPDFKPENYYAVCYAAGIGRVAEYAPNVLSEVISYSIRKDGPGAGSPPPATR